MTITPDKSAQAQARERLEAECLSWSSAAAAMRSHGSPHAGSADDCERNASDLRLVLDALADAEREAAKQLRAIKARNELGTFSDYRPALVCEGCHRVVRALRDGLCDPCFLKGIPQ